MQLPISFILSLGAKTHGLFTYAEQHSEILSDTVWILWTLTNKQHIVICGNLLHSINQWLGGRR